MNMYTNKLECNFVDWIVALATVTLLLVALSLLGGCSPGEAERIARQRATEAEAIAKDLAAARSDAANSSTIVAKDLVDHGHLPGAHGGIMVSLGQDSYHVEAVVDSTGAVRLYTLGKDESRVIDVESQSLKGFVKADGEVDSEAISFEPAPQDGDASGRTSLFIGQLPTELVGRKLDLTIPNIRIDGERFRLGFVTGQENHDEDEIGMPSKIANDAERELYLKPGGIYTSADIAANGNVTASQKFKGLKSAHDMKPKVGDMLCPISGTKANQNFTWIIGGKSYQFCCPPCVDEYLASAKSSSNSLPDPESFIKK